MERRLADAIAAAGPALIGYAIVNRLPADICSSGVSQLFRNQAVAAPDLRAAMMEELAKMQSLPQTVRGWLREWDY